jgi:hypothetical protein
MASTSTLVGPIRIGRAHLPGVRIAARLLRDNDVELEEHLAIFASNGVVPVMLDGWIRTKGQLAALIEMLDAMVNRSFLVLERLGYEPDKPPPDARVVN